MVLEYEDIVYEKRGHVTVITLNRPERMNAIGPRTHAELVQAWNDFRDDDDAYVAVMTGAGTKAFSAGGDIRAAATMEEFDGVSALPRTPAQRAAHARGEWPGILGPSRWTDLYKPVIAAVNGVAYAGGLEWACWADIAIADSHSTFGVTCRRWNFGLADGGTQRLPKIVGYRRAMELIITGRVIDATEALEIGLVNEVVPSGASLSRALELAEQIVELPQPAIRTDKEAVIRGYGRPIDEGMRIEAECFNRLIEMPEFANGQRQFLERDHPDRRPGVAATVGIARPNTAPVEP